MRVITAVLLLASTNAFAFSPVLRKEHGHAAAVLASGRRASRLVMQEEDGSGFSQRTQMREEIEAPFAKVRSFVWPALAAAAGIGTYFAATTLLAEAAGLRPAAPDSLTNLAVDVTALGTTGWLTVRETRARDARLKRIGQGAALANLRVLPLDGGAKTVKLGELRSRPSSRKEALLEAYDLGARRVILLAASEPTLAASLASARALAPELVECELLVVPLVLRAAAPGAAPRLELPEEAAVAPAAAGEPGDAAPTAHLALPQGLGQWAQVLASELETAAGQEADVATRGLTIVLKKNGRVGTRRLGMPDWAGLVGDVAARVGSGLDTTNI